MSTDDLKMPEGLSDKGKAAYETIMTFLKEKKATDTGGCRAFYSPKEWREKGEEYGCESELVVVYDGGDLRGIFSLDGCYDNGGGTGAASSYAPYEELQERLGKLGMHSDECTTWYCAVYLG